MVKAPRIVVFGAGAIGAYVGVRLSADGAPVTLVGRPDLVAAADRLVAVDLEGRSQGPGSDLVVTAIWEGRQAAEGILDYLGV